MRARRASARRPDRTCRGGTIRDRTPLQSCRPRSRTAAPVIYKTVDQSSVIRIAMAADRALTSINVE